MRIALAVHHFPPRYQGGAEWRAYRTARALMARGHEVRVIAVEHDARFGLAPAAMDEVFQGVPVRRLGMDVAHLPFRQTFANHAVGNAVRDFVGAWGAELLHLIGGYLMTGAVIEAAKDAGLPVVLTLTDFWFLCPRFTLVRAGGALCDVPADPMACALCLSQDKRRFLVPDRLTGGRFGKALLWAWRSAAAQRLSGVADLAGGMPERRVYLRRVFGMADWVISPSRFLKDLHEREGFQAARFVYMRQGLDVSEWAPHARAPRDPDAPLRIGFAGQVAPHKGVHVLIEAFRALRGAAELFIYGDLGRFPDYAARLRRMAGAAPRIHFEGQYTRADAGRVLAGLDVLVVPSMWYENSPNSILEAFVAGTPVVASDLGGMAELVAHEVNGLVFPVGDAAALAACLQRVVDAPALLDRFAAALPSVKTVDEEAAELEDIYCVVRPTLVTSK
ncbi:MAG: glycosyltransferase family 4 protein [Anaerolineae bacterium]